MLKTQVIQTTCEKEKWQLLLMNIEPQDNIYSKNKGPTSNSMK
jgi:hypothetical protein